MPISENAKAVLERRYLARDEQGQPTETVDGLFRRVANAVAEGDRRFDSKADVVATAKEFYELMVSLDFLPNSPTLMNAGRPLGQLSACFVLPVADSMEDIFDAIKNAALIHKSGGGTGFSFSRLRPKGSTVNSTGGVASGPISFMKVFNAATEAVKQGGTRRGANMGILRVDHPDILEFITCKNDTREITNFNLSVGITEAFMEAVSQDKPYDLVDPATGRVVGQHSARAVFDAIVTSAWQTGEPGIIFLDRLNRDNVVPSQGEIESTNPCGEQPLLPYESCNLGSINLVNHLMKTPAGWVLDRAKLEKTIRTAVHFLDNVIEVNQYPLPEIDRMTRSTRKIGLGVMGFADMLLHMGVPYNSEEGVALAEEIMDTVNSIGHQASEELAEIRGPFPLFDQSIYRDGRPIRNATVTTIAPTGTLSIIAGVSSGVEPVFAYAYIRNVMDGTHLIETNQILKDRLVEAGIYSDELMQKIVEQGSLAHVDGIPEDIRRVFVCAHDVSPHLACENAGRLPAVHRQRGEQDGELPQLRHQGGGRRGLPAGLHSGLQGHHHLPGRKPQRAGAQHRQGQRRQGRHRRPGGGRRAGLRLRGHGLPDQIRSLRPYPAEAAPRRHQRLYRKGAHRLRQPLYHCQLRRERHL